MLEESDEPPPITKPWHCAIEGERRGPFRADELITLMESGQVKAETLAWRKGMEEWRPVLAIPELAGLLAQAKTPLRKYVESVSGAVQSGGRAAWRKTQAAAQSAEEAIGKEYKEFQARQSPPKPRPAPQAESAAFSAGASVAKLPQSSQGIVAWTCGLLVSFFLPWFNFFGGSISGYEIGQLGSYGNYAWVIPILATATLLRVMSGKSGVMLAAVTGLVPFVAIFYGLIEIGGGISSDILEFLFHVLSIGAYLTLICSLCLIGAAQQASPRIFVGRGPGAPDQS